MTYHELSIEERVTIQIGQMNGLSQRAIAGLLGRSPSTVSRELRRNSRPKAAYVAHLAQSQTLKRRKVCRPARRLLPGSELFELVIALLRQRFSPEQIAGKLRSMSIPSFEDAYVCRETIYNAIYALPVGELRKELIICLRQGKSSRRPRSGGVDRRGQIPDMVSIHVRPPEIEDRLMPGHWEGDLIKGQANASAIGTLVERTTRLVLLVKLPHPHPATAAHVLQAFSDKLNAIASPMRESLTYDRGSEMARHQELSQSTGMKVYFCDPHSPWQRGSNENTNGLLRQYFPKGTDLSGYSQEQLDAVADQLNGRPRMTLGWRKPIEVYAEHLARLTHQPDSFH